MNLFNTNDENIINALKLGDRKAFTFIYEEYYNRLCKYIYSLSNDSELVEDIVQDTFIYLWVNHAEININKSLTAYLYRSAYNSFIDKCRAKSRKKNMIKQWHIEAIIEFENDEEINQEKKIILLQRAISTLPKKCREVFVLNKLNNYKYKEIAAMLNISERTVEGQIRKAMIKIRKKVAELKLNTFSLLLFSLLIK